jgi:hypothetical protein
MTTSEDRGIYVYEITGILESLKGEWGLREEE